MAQAEEDPISSFSSPPTSPKHVPTPAQPKKDIAVLLDDDDDLPEVAELIGKKTNTRRGNLLEAKKRALVASKQHTPDDDDDDLLIQDKPTSVKVVIESAKKPRVSTIRKQQNQLARVPAKKAALNFSINDPRVKLEAILKSEPDQQTLNQVMAIMAQQDALEMKKKKMQEYEKHGGQLRSNVQENPKGFQAAVKEIAEKRLKAADTRETARMEIGTNDEEDPEDVDWEPPLRGSASPEASDHEEDEMEVENDENRSFAENGTPMLEDDAEELVTVKTKAARKVLIESDSEEEPNDENLPPQPPTHRNSTRSLSPAEDEGDKENDGNLVYDRDEDKENAIMTRRSVITGTPDGSLGNHRAATLSPDLPPRNWGARGRPGDHPLSLDTERVPFRDLTDDSPFGSPVRPGQSFAAKLQQASPLPSTLVPEPTLKPVFSLKGKGKVADEGFGGFSQFSQSGEGLSCALDFPGPTQQFAAAPLLEPGFTDLFESPGASERSSRQKGRIAEVSLIMLPVSFFSVLFSCVSRIIFPS